MNSETFGLRNNNPGNIRATGIQWLGQCGKNQGFAVFDTTLHGVRAIVVIIKTYLLVDGENTIRKIISRWAPTNENNTQSYIDDVCARTGNLPDAPFKPTREDVQSIVAAIITHENGDNGWSYFVANRGGYGTIDEAINLSGWVFS